MHLNGFFRIGWLLQLAVGIALFAVSFLIESQVLQSFFAAPALALVLTIALEGAKALAIVWHRYLDQTGAEGYTPLTRRLSAGFRFGLIGLSVLCSALYLGLHLDRPNLEAVREARSAVIDARLQEDLQRLDSERRARIGADRARRATEYTDARRQREARIEALEAELRTEMDNVVGGVFKGPRYRELEARLIDAQDARDRALATLAERHRREAAALATELAQRHERARAERIQAAKAERRALDRGGFDADDQVHHPRVVVFMRMAETLFDVQVSAPAFVFLFSLFLSLLMELGILLAFDTITLAILPALAVQHREEVMNEALRAQTQGTADRDAIRHRGAMDRVRAGAERIMERAQAQAHARSQPKPGSEPESKPRRAA